MKILEVKKLLSKTFKTTVLAISFAATMTGCAFQFSRGDPASEISDKTVENFITSIEVEINETDWTDTEQANNSANHVVQKAEQIIDKEDALEDLQKVSIIRVVDGDTIVVDIEADNCGKPEHEYTVRLIGVNTPESVAPEEYLKRTGKENTAAGLEASEYTKMLLENVDYVYLQKDVSETDRYNRLLRYVWLEIPTNEYDLNEIANCMLNGILVKDHVAEITPYEPDTEYIDEFEEIYNMDYDEFN